MCLFEVETVSLQVSEIIQMCARQSGNSCEMVLMSD